MEKYTQLKKGMEKMKKLTAILLLCLTLSLLPVGVFAEGGFGAGVASAAADVRVVKSALYGKKLAISDLDIKQALAISDFDSITVTKIPEKSEGALMLGGKRIEDGTTIKRRNLASLVFIPAEKSVSEARFYFTVENALDGREIEFLIRYTDKINKEPELSENASTFNVLSTQREIGVYSKMSANDPEGDGVEFIVVSYPRLGTLEVLDKENGEYLYTPPYSFVGNDSFSYVCRDEWGNFSKVATVDIKVEERMSEVVYLDMLSRPEYGSAVAMTALGIMSGEGAFEGVYFNPDKEVSRAEFVAMALKIAGISPDTSLKKSYFDDNADIPKALCAYVATAQKMGIIQGAFTGGRLLFSPNSPITKYEAASVLAAIADLNYEGEAPMFCDVHDIPVFARESVYSLYALGILESENGAINPRETVTRAKCAEYLYKLYKL